MVNLGLGKTVAIMEMEMLFLLIQDHVSQLPGMGLTGLREEAQFIIPLV